MKVAFLIVMLVAILLGAIWAISELEDSKTIMDIIASCIFLMISFIVISIVL